MLLALEVVVRPAQRDGASPDPLHCLVGGLASLLDDDLAEKRTEKSDLPSLRVASPGGADAGRFGTAGQLGAAGRGR